jgi:lipid-A-disaccharide synthase
MPRRILIVAGELSADRYAASLAAEFRELGPVEIVAIGGPLLRECSDYFVGDCTAHVSVGLGDRLRGVRPIFRVLDSLTALLDQSPVDQAVIVDFPNFNFEVSRRLHSYKIPIDTLITPNFWIWKDRRLARKVVAYSRNIVTIFPPEYALYQPLSSRVFYFGHPILDMMPERPDRALSPALEDGADRPIRVGLFPGSRASELRLLLRALIETGAELRRHSSRFEFILPVARPEFQGWVQAEIARATLTHSVITPALSTDQMAALDFAICATGTMTLEVVLHRIPMIVLGALPSFTYFFARHILRLDMPYVGLPNIIAGETIVPEFVQRDIQPTVIAREVVSQLSHQNQQIQQARYTTLIQLLRGTSPGSVLSQVARQLTV